MYRQLVPLPRGIVPAKMSARVPVARLRSPEVTFGEVSGLVDGDIGCGVGAVFKTAPAHVADQAYRIDIGPDGVKVVAGGEAGARYARVTLDQLAKLAED